MCDAPRVPRDPTYLHLRRLLLLREGTPMTNLGPRLQCRHHPAAHEHTTTLIIITTIVMHLIRWRLEKLIEILLLVVVVDGRRPSFFLRDSSLIAQFRSKSKRERHRILRFSASSVVQEICVEKLVAEQVSERVTAISVVFLSVSLSEFIRLMLQIAFRSFDSPTVTSAVHHTVTSHANSSDISTRRRNE